MDKYKLMNKRDLVKLLISKGKEGYFWDFKEKWPENKCDLLKDIICFANTLHDLDCYLIFGVTNDGFSLENVPNEDRKAQADVIDFLSKIPFAGDIIPRVSVDNIVVDDKKIDVLTIYNINNTPVYLNKSYSARSGDKSKILYPGTIYSRIEDRNTSSDTTSDREMTENLWKKRFGMLKPVKDFIIERLINKSEWNENENGFYNIYRPECVLEYSCGDETFMEPYCLLLLNGEGYRKKYIIKYHQSIIDEFYTVVLDGGRLEIPYPELAVVEGKDRFENSLRLFYYVEGSCKHSILEFLKAHWIYDGFMDYREISDMIITFISLDEKEKFINYVIANYDKILDLTEKTNVITYESNIGGRYNIELMKREVKFGIVLKGILDQWRISNQ